MIRKRDRGNDFYTYIGKYHSVQLNRSEMKINRLNNANNMTILKGSSFKGISRIRILKTLSLILQIYCLHVTYFIMIKMSL